NNVGIGFSASAAATPTAPLGTFAGSYYTVRRPSDPLNTVDTSGMLVAGKAFYVRTFGGRDNRWGDYTAISIDPSNDSRFWLFNENASTRGTAFGGEDGRWETSFG